MRHILIGESPFFQHSTNIPGSGTSGHLRSPCLLAERTRELAFKQLPVNRFRQVIACFERDCSGRTVR